MVVTELRKLLSRTRARCLFSASSALLLGALVAPQAALAQWNTQSPLPTHLSVRGVSAPTPARVFLATDDNSFDSSGALFESADGGGTWTQRNVPFDLSNAFHGVQFLDAQNGWAWGNANYRTLDGGATWVQLPFLGSTYFMHFWRPDFGLATGNFGAKISRDGGVSWDLSPAEMRDFAFADATTGLGGAASGLYRTTDGGATFVPVHAGAAQAVAFLSSTVALAIVDATFLRSIDGGATWIAVGASDGRSELVAVSPTVALAWGRAGSFPDYDDRVLRSADGGATWTDLGEVLDPGSNSGRLSFALPAEGVVVVSDGAGNIHRSADAGLTWSRAFSSPGPYPDYLSSNTLAFADAQTGYFGAGAGFVVKTVDGGQSWNQVSSGIGNSLLAMDRFPNGDLIAVGAAGRVLTSVGGLAPWIVRATLGATDLEAVQVLGSAGAVAVDQSGRIYRTADAGATWAAATSVPSGLNSAADVSFLTASNGWVVGQGFNGAALFHTVDGGATWAPVPDFQGTYAAVDFAGASGWAAAVYGTVYRTTDGGGSWTEGNLPGSALTILDLDFWNATVGYAVGGSGYAARSGDGGISWQMLPTPSTTDRITDIELIGADELWVSTAAGIAMYSATGGQSWAVMDAGEPELGSFSALAASPAGDAWIAGWGGLIRHFAGPPTTPVNWPPVASFSFQTTGLSVSFTDTSSDSDGTIVAWQWSFGDGATSNAQNPTHLFPADDTYIVTLTVTDDDGDSDIGGRAIVVQTGPGGTFGEFTEVTPLDPLFVTPQDEDFWVATTAPADYDGDGDLDIAVLGFYVVYNESVVHRLVLVRNDGPTSATEWDFSYIDVPLGELTSGASDLAWGDVDGDGDPDLAVGSDGQTVLYRNDAGTLVASDTVLPGYWEDNGQADFDLRSISWADYDNDGDLDLLLPSVWDEETFESRTALMRNDGRNGSGFLFTEVDAGLAPTAHAQSSWADFDGDLDLDLLLVHISPLNEDGFIRRYRNDGGGLFVGEDILGTLTVEHGEAQWGDYDDDGDLDILIAGNIRELDGSYNTVLRLYRNDAETFEPVDIIACTFCGGDGWLDLSAATWADYDSDGDIDILLAGSFNPGSQLAGRAKIYDNDGGVFVDSGNQLPAPMASGDRGGSFSWLDLDGDGDLDYFIAGQYFVPGGNGLVEAQMHVYLNDAPAQNQAPTPPSALASGVSGGGSVALSWSAASDDLTPAEALTYELRLYRGGAPVSLARRVPEAGNLSAAGEWTLHGLPEGFYSWTLEAVDSAFNSGPAARATFVVGQPLFNDGFGSANTAAWSASQP